MGYETGETHEIVVTYNGEPVEDYMSLVIEAVHKTISSRLSTVRRVLNLLSLDE